MSQSINEMTDSSSAADLIARLHSSDAYDHPVERVSVIETHISWVLLTGEFAYKVKKPVEFGFVDFRSLAQRRHFCEEELRLNRRLAPELYVDVVSITGTSTHPTMGGSGDAIEYAVKMRQFPQESLLSEMIDRGTMTVDHVDRLTKQLAVFHACIPTAVPESRYGTPEVVWNAAVQNFDRVLPLDEFASLAQRLLAWSRDEFHRRVDDLASRKSSGFVRECHGDLHLGNMVALDGDVTIFDCIEFNDEFRWIDVLSETAFALMDVIERGREDFAHRLLNGYLEKTGDYGGLSVLRFYLVYRAMVRAKVNAIQLSQSKHSSDRRDRRNELERYLSVADRLSRPKRPLLVITHGLSGSGKSTVSGSLLERIGAVRIRSDVERKRLFATASRSGANAIHDAIYGAAATEATYSCLAELARDMICSGHSVIVDATFLSRAQRDRFRQLAERLRVPFAILDVSISEPLLRMRIARREADGNDVSDAGLDVLEHQLRTREPLGEDEVPFALPIDSSDDTMITRAMTFLKRLQSS